MSYVSPDPAFDSEALARGDLALDIPALAKEISWVEDGGKLPDTFLDAGKAKSQTIGITGSPGVGKSTLTSAIVKAIRKAGELVAVLAVDPSSPITGGALLGDRIRMQEHYLDAGVYIRSMGSRGHLGGLAAATPQAIALVAHAGFTEIIVETVGVGQSEVEVMNHVETTIVVLSPGAGDDIQSAKAGILEVADIFIINKIDRDLEGAQKLHQELIRSQELSARHDGWRAPVVMTSALDRTGVTEVVTAIKKHQEFKRSARG